MICSQYSKTMLEYQNCSFILIICYHQNLEIFMQNQILFLHMDPSDLALEGGRDYHFCEADDPEAWSFNPATRLLTFRGNVVEDRLNEAYVIVERAHRHNRTRFMLPSLPP